MTMLCSNNTDTLCVRVFLIHLILSFISLLRCVSLRQHKLAAQAFKIFV